ncbi:MAG: hypothetical protein IPJ65_20265 [Archangiaceae bacterium]|nr:hypothetical protein [Archangiaceae bacterium]
MLPLAVASYLLLAAAEVTVALPGFAGTPDVPSQKRDFLVEYFSERLTAAGGLTVTTPSQIAAVLGVERQKQLLGCSDNSEACSAELAGALGVDALIIGSVAKVGEETAVTVKALDAKTSKVIASMSGRDRREEAVLDFLAAAATQLSAELLRKLRGVEVTPRSPPSRFGVKVWLPAALGLAAGVTSAALFGYAKSSEGRLKSGDPTVGDQAAAHRLAQGASTAQLVSGVMLGVAVAGVAVACLFYFLFADEPARRVELAGPLSFTAWSRGAP